MTEATTTAVPVVATVVVVSHNNQPGLVATAPTHNNPRALPLPTSVRRIGTTATLMVVTLMTPTQALRLGIRAQHTTQMQLAPRSPPAAAAPTATPTSVILPYPRHVATWRWHVPCAGNHAHAGAAARPRHDDFFGTAVPSTKCHKCADDAATSPAGDTHDGTLLCSQPATLLCPQSATAGVLLTSRGGL
jgi:hypothetical protein